MRGTVTPQEQYFVDIFFCQIFFPLLILPSCFFSVIIFLPYCVFAAVYSQGLNTLKQDESVEKSTLLKLIDDSAVSAAYLH